MSAGIFLVLIGLAGGIATAQSPQWIKIPGGTYKPLITPSDADPKNRAKIPQRSVDAFEVRETSVTNAEFLSFVKKNPEWRRDKIKGVFADDRYLKHWKSATDIGDPKLLNEPVVNVSWFAAKAFCGSQHARLPTTDEWEYLASREDSAKLNKVILKWYSRPADGSDTPTGTVYIGKDGVKDMVGKIWEWTSDFNSSFVTGESREDMSLSRSLFCGSGSIGSADPSDYATFMRFAFRSSLKARYTQPTLGFRCARNVRSQ